MTRLNDYLRAERPDETEPASFYIPGADDWLTVKKTRRPRGGGHEDPVDAELNCADVHDTDPYAAAQQVAAFHERD